VSLKRQILTLVAIVLGLAYAGTLYISIKSTQDYLNNQLSVHAQDTATSLGLSLAPVIRKQDLAQANSMIDVIFDRGYFKHISLDAWRGSFKVKRELDVWTAKAPGWFVKMLALDTPVQTSEIFVDWKNRAQLSVSIHPGYAYDELWKITRNNILWLSLVTIFVSVLVFYGLRRLLQPLAKTEQQALAIAQKEYLFQDELPRARELRNVVTAMNLMTEKVRSNIEMQVELANSYQQLAYRDALTGLANRRGYLAELTSFMQDREEFRNAAVLIIHLSGLTNANENYGYEYGDEELKTVRNCLCCLRLGEEKQVLARIGGADFALLIRNPHANEAVECAEIILNSYSAEGENKYPGDLYIGITEFNSEKNVREILSEADQARRQAESADSRKWHIFEKPSASTSGAKTASEWRALLEEIIEVEPERFEIYVQPVKYFNREKINLVEVLLRMNEAGQTVAAGVFLPTAQDHGLVHKIDRLVVSRVLEYSGANPDMLYAVNLNIASLEDADFVQWLLDILAKAGDRGRHLLFEVGESGQLKSAAMQDRLKRLADCSAGVAIERFGSGNHDFGYLLKLKLRYIKVSGHYIRGIEDNSEHQFYLRTLLQMAHNLELDVIAEPVETEAVARMLEELGFDAIQGYYIGHPQPI